MTSPCKRHNQRVLASQSQAAEAETPRDANGYELMLMKMAQDKRRLKEVQSMERKAEVKRELLPEYEPWVEGVLTGQQGVQDDVLMTVMVWRIDAGDLAGALPIARYAIAHKLSMPDQYKRETACLIAEEFSDIALRWLVAGGALPDGIVIALQEVETITAKEDMPDEVRAKLHKAIGCGLNSQAGGTDGADIGRKQNALEYLKRAIALHEKCGVKKDIEKLERELKNSTPANAGG